ncbi:hypothetical protein HYX09_03445, partial [Candidatus Woesearchaeota archaeon]|nr:hypothetical protein [Candidatus Woesearchaeota archaeon]
VYEALGRLASRGLVASVARNKVKWFEAKSPESVFSLIDEKQEELASIRQDVEEGMTSLKKHIKSDKALLEAGIFIGKKGLRMLLEDILKENKHISIIGSKLQFRELFGPYYELWHRQRIERKITQRTIFPDKLKNKVIKRKYLEYRFVDDKFTNPTATIIYGSNCLFIQWSKEPIVIKIQSRGIAKSHLNYFNLLWTSKT